MRHKTVEFHSPPTYQSAFRYLQTLDGKAAFLNGGVSINWNNNPTPFLIALDHIISKEICTRDDGIEIGAGCKLAEVANSDILAAPVFSSLRKSCALVASPQIRNMASIGGNLISHFDFSDTLGSLYILKPQLEVILEDGPHLYEFDRYISEKTRKFAFPKNEILNKFIIGSERLKYYTRSHFHKESRVKRDIATLNITIFRQSESNRFDLAIGSCWDHIQIFNNIKKSEAIEQQLARLPAPKSDLRASSSYRSRILVPLIQEGFTACQ